MSKKNDSLDIDWGAVKKSVGACSAAIQQLRKANDKLDSSLCAMYNVVQCNYAREHFYAPFAGNVARNKHWGNEFEKAYMDISIAAQKNS